MNDSFKLIVKVISISIGVMIFTFTTFATIDMVNEKHNEVLRRLDGIQDLQKEIIKKLWEISR